MIFRLFPFLTLNPSFEAQCLYNHADKPHAGKYTILPGAWQLFFKDFQGFFRGSKFPK